MTRDDWGLLGITGMTRHDRVGYGWQGISGMTRDE